MKKKSLKSLKLNKKLISSVNQPVGGRGLGYFSIPFSDCCLTAPCPTESEEGRCYTENPNECIAPPNP
ncbi:hypothetical protein [Kordia jejudonensis]|uniref:hypothetical protein n=1 Tax=Kordia jejudonensis TaxID=1348245 RepID=UPI0006292C34|nr:hypothetical protein [Kordia jejudonensis]